MTHKHLKHFATLLIALVAAAPYATNATTCLKSDIAGECSAFGGSININFDGYGYGKFNFTNADSFNASPAVSYLQLKSGSKVTFKSGNVTLNSACVSSDSLIFFNTKILREINIQEARKS